jgi:hypothetical protein
MILTISARFEMIDPFSVAMAINAIHDDSGTAHLESDGPVGVLLQALRAHKLQVVDARPRPKPAPEGEDQPGPSASPVSPPLFPRDSGVQVTQSKTDFKL